MGKITALAGLRVIDFSNTRVGAQASQTLADFGADVIHVEPPGGSALRKESAWPMWGRGKRSLQLDLHKAEDRAVAQSLARGADAVIETNRPGVAERLGIGYEELKRDNPGLIYCSITGFGRVGPWANVQGYEHVVMARMAVMSVLGPLTHREGPTFCNAAYAAYPTSQLAIQGILAALYERDQSGLGQRVDTSLIQGLTVQDTYQWFTRVMALRYPDAFAQAPRVVNGVPSSGISFRLLIALTKDGKYLQFSQTSERLFRAMMKMFGLDWMYDDPDWKDAPDYADDPKRRVAFWEKLLTIVRTKTAAEWLEEFNRDPMVWGELFRNGSDGLNHPQMLWNQMVLEREDRDFGKIRSPGPVVRMDKTPAQLDRPAPRLGEHDKALRAEAQSAEPSRLKTTEPRGAPRPPLDGVTVVELGSFYAAPFGPTLLADMGARVIKIEPLEGDPQRLFMFPEIGGMKALLGKESVAVDLTTKQGLEIACRIIAKADMVMQSFRAGAAEKLKLDAASLHKFNPNLVYQASPGYGEDGPYGYRPAYAPTIGAAAGLAWRQAGASIPQGPDLSLEEVKDSAMRLATAVMGYGNSDGLSAVTVATGLMLGLVARNRGAGGQHQLTSMLSSTAHAICENLIEYEGKPEPPTCDGDFYGFHALYRLYPVANGEWVFLAAPQEREWQRLTGALPGGDKLRADPRFADVAARKANDAALAEALTKILAARPSAAWERDLRAADVACVQSPPTTAEAQYMDEGSVGRDCDLVTTCHHTMLDEVPRLKGLVRFSHSTMRTDGADLCGEHTAAVLGEFGYSEAEIAKMAEDKVIALG